MIFREFADGPVAALESRGAASAPNRHYMRIAVADLDGSELVRLWRAMMKRKHLHRYSDIARIWIVMECRQAGPKAAVKRATALGISSETRRQWFGPGLVEWLARMRRMEKLDKPEVSSTVVAAPPILKLSVEDMDWIESLFVAEPVRNRVYRQFTDRLRQFAAKTPGRTHLGFISYSTVWRLCRRLKTCVVTEGARIPERPKRSRKKSVRRQEGATVGDSLLITVPSAPADDNVPF